MADFREILAGFRELWAGLYDNALSLSIAFPIEVDDDFQSPDLSDVAVLSRIRIPSTPKFDVFTPESWVICRAADEPESAFETFKALCKAAGAYLPSEYREKLKRYDPFLESSPARWWLALYLFLRGVTQTKEIWPAVPAYGIDGSGEYTLPGAIGIGSPIPDMIRIIELLRLNTEDPVPIDAWFSEGLAALKASETNGISRVVRLAETHPAWMPPCTQGIRSNVTNESPLLPQGISLRDAALLLCEGDRDSVRQTKKRWQNSRTINLPEPLGKCREDNRTYLYSLSAVIDFVRKIEKRSEDDLSSLKTQLRHRERSVRAE